MKVRATQKGIYGSHRRYPGKVFELTDPKHFSERWMEKAETESPSPPAPEVVAEPDSDLESLREKYATVFGKKPFHGWDAEKLKEKISGAAS